MRRKLLNTKKDIALQSERGREKKGGREKWEARERVRDIERERVKKKRREISSKPDGLIGRKNLEERERDGGRGEKVRRKKRGRR